MDDWNTKLDIFYELIKVTLTGIKALYCYKFFIEFVTWEEYQHKSSSKANPSESPNPFFYCFKVNNDING